METITMSVEGLNVNAVTKALQRARGVQGVDVDLMTNIATVTFDETELDADHVRQVVQKTHHRSH